MKFLRDRLESVRVTVSCIAAPRLSAGSPPARFIRIGNSVG